MADMLRDGMASLAATLKAHAAQQVTYRRGVSTVALMATLGQTRLLLADEFGATRIEWTDRDFLFTAADLVLGGDATRPKKGDVITYEDAGGLHTFEVLPYGDEPHWKWCDPYRLMIRVHTKRISTEAT